MVVLRKNLLNIPEEEIGRVFEIKHTDMYGYTLGNVWAFPDLEFLERNEMVEFLNEPLNNEESHPNSILNNLNMDLIN